MAVKVIVLGESNVGKTAIINRLIGQPFNDTPSPSTVGVDIATILTVVGNTTVKLNIWDTPGQNNFRQVIPKIYENAHVAIFVYDVSCVETFEKLNNWLTNLSRYAPQDCRRLIIGNKTDVPKRINAKMDKLLFFANNNLEHPQIHELSAKTMIAPKGLLKVIASAGKAVADGRSQIQAFQNDILMSDGHENNGGKQKCSKTCCFGCFGWFKKKF